MKVAHIVSTFYPHLGGMGEVCLLESDFLTKNGVEVEVFSLFYPGTAYADEDLGFKINRVKPILKFGDAGWLHSFKDKLRDFDIVHFHFPFYGAEREVIKAKQEFGFKLILTYHMDAQTKGLKKIGKNILDFLYGKKLFEIADKVLYVDEERWHSFKFYNEIIKLKSVYLPNAIDTAVFKTKQVDFGEVGLEKYAENKIVLFVGNLLPVKNLETLIKAMSGMNKKNVLLIVGGGYKEKKYKKMVKEEGLQEKVIFYGPVKDKEKLAKIYNLASVVCVPSFYESFSLSAVEALACGVPVIGNNIPGIRGRITNGVDGVLLTENTPYSWQDTINSVVDYTKEQREIIANKAKEKISLNYNIQKHTEKLLQIYNS